MIRLRLVLASLSVSLVLSGCGRLQSVDVASEESPVYNAEFSPQLARSANSSRPVLRPAVFTDLSFNIGPRSAKSVLGDTAPDPDILRATADVPLTVVAMCDFCEHGSSMLQHIVYQPTARRSDTVKFRMMPKPLTAGASNYIGKIRLAVLDQRSGREYDQLEIDVLIAEGDNVLENAGAVSVEFPSPASRNSEPDCDVELSIVEESGKAMAISIVPIQPALKVSLAPLGVASGGKPRVFRTPFVTSDLEQIAGGSFAQVSAISLQGDLVESMRRSGAAATVSKESQKNLKLTPEEGNAVSKIIGNVGKTLYASLFATGDDAKDLSPIIEALETAAASAPSDKPLRMKIVTGKLSLPWQYLHPAGPGVTPDRFWGMRFSLAVYRSASQARARPAPTDAKRVVYARYGTTSDESVPYAKQQIEQLKTLSPMDLSVVQSRADLVDGALTEDREKISALVMFLHATAGTTITATKSTTVSMQSAEGPMLYFADGDVVRADTLLQLRGNLTAQQSTANWRYLPGAPLVILNACETGPSTASVPFVSFLQAMSELGAQGVIVTEVSVWPTLGHAVATRLITRLGKGETASDALTLARRELYAGNNNPLGLLYAYYGDPTATLRR
jgi:hypothetical protein